MHGGGAGQDLPAQGPTSTFLPIVSSLGHAGQDHVDFGPAEPHTVLFHEPGSSSVWVGGRSKVYVFDFSKDRNTSMRTVSLDPSPDPLFSSPFPIFLSPLWPWRGASGNPGELAFLPELVNPLLYPINGPWGRLPEGGPNWRGCWGSVERSAELTRLAGRVALTAEA